MSFIGLLMSKNIAHRGFFLGLGSVMLVEFVAPVFEVMTLFDCASGCMSHLGIAQRSSSQKNEENRKLHCSIVETWSCN